MHLPDKPCNYAPGSLYGWHRLRCAHVHTPVGVCIGAVSILTTKTTTRSSTVVKQERACMQGNMFCETGTLVLFLDYIKMWQLCTVAHEIANSTKFLCGQHMYYCNCNYLHAVSNAVLDSSWGYHLWPARWWCSFLSRTYNWNVQYVILINLVWHGTRTS